MQHKARQLRVEAPQQVAAQNICLAAGDRASQQAKAKEEISLVVVTT